MKQRITQRRLTRQRQHLSGRQFMVSIAAVIVFIAGYSSLNVSTTVKSYAANKSYAALEESKPITANADSSLIAPACTDNNTP